LRVTNHEHSEPEKKALNRQIMSNFLKRKALVDISCKPSRLIRSELKQGDLPTLTINDLSLIRHNIHRGARLSVHPPLTSYIEELHAALWYMEIKTNIDEQFLFVNDKANSIVGFSTQQIIKVLCDVKKIYVVGPFKSYPKNFTQLYTIHGLKNDVNLLLVFFYYPTR